MKVTSINYVTPITITFHGLTIRFTSPNFNPNYLAINKNGDLFAYQYKPKLYDTYFWSAIENDEELYIGNVSYDGDWKESLISL